MKNRIVSKLQSAVSLAHNPKVAHVRKHSQLPEILFITSFPPRECGIATYSEDLINAIQARFVDSFNISICALENDREQFEYSENVRFILNTDDCGSFDSLAKAINLDDTIQMVVVQHEFGLFGKCPDKFTAMLSAIEKAKITVFHTVLPGTPEDFRENVRKIAKCSDGLIVMTKNAQSILQSDYGVSPDKVTVIPHGTHLVAHTDKEILKDKYNLRNRHILSTFGLLSSGKSIETTLDALPSIVKTTPDVLFLIIGKTHPGVVAREGESYREFLQDKITRLGLENHVRFVNKYVPLNELLEYLQLTDIYLFTSKDPNQAVSGTFAYAASCGCAIVSTPIPHAVEFLSGDSGLVVEFQNDRQLAEAVNRLLFDVKLRQTVKLNALHKIVKTAWENAALSHVRLFEKLMPVPMSLHYKLPPITLRHIKKMTTGFGMLQFCKINRPDHSSGYTLDDNARALIAICRHFELTGNPDDLHLIRIYLDFIRYCQTSDGTFLNFVDFKENFTSQNADSNLEDANGRAIWALGYMISLGDLIPNGLLETATSVFERTLPSIEHWYSTRAMAFAIKGLHYYNLVHGSHAVKLLVSKLADRLSQMYLHESSTEWQWFESYLTYANSVLPEALLYAYKETEEETYREIAQGSFNFLLGEIFTQSNEIRVISNRNWYVRGGERNHFGEQPIDVAYTIFALENFYAIFSDEKYRAYMETAFEWFLGRNHLGQIVYNPCTGGCYDGLEEHNVNLNQGAESALSYLLARLCMERIGYFKGIRRAKINRLKHENYNFGV